MKTPPSFMEADSDLHLRRSMSENPELWIAAARFAAMGGRGVEDRIALVMEAAEVGYAESLSAWRHAVAEYSAYDLQQGGATRGENPDRPARALYVEAALLRLLQLVDAPAAIAEDLKHFLASSKPKEAEKRAALQKVLIEQPDIRSPAQLARLAGCDRKLAERYLADGSVQIMP